MKQRHKISLLFTFLFLFIAESSQCQSKKRSFEWATFTLPTTVGQLINGLGNYTKFIPGRQHLHFTLRFAIN